MFDLSILMLMPLLALPLVGLLMLPYFVERTTQPELSPVHALVEVQSTPYPSSDSMKSVKRMRV